MRFMTISSSIKTPNSLFLYYLNYSPLTMKFNQLRHISTQLNPKSINPNSQIFKNPKFTPIPLPFKTLNQPKGQDLDYINIAHSHLLHSDWSNLQKLNPNFDSFKVNHILLKLQTNYSISLKFYNFINTHNPKLITLEAIAIVLHILTKNRKFVSAESVLKKIVVCNDMKVHCKLFDEIVCSYRMCDSTPRVFDAVFKMYAQVKQFRNATDTFCRMKEYGFVPSVESCNLYLSSLLSMNRADIVLLFSNKMRRSKIVGNVFTVNMMINGYCQLGKLDDARQLFDEMPDLGFKHFVSSYNILIAAYVNRGLLTTGMKLKVAMETMGIAPNVITYNILINGFCKEGKLQDAYKMFNEMNRMNVAPNTITYNTLISGFCKSGKTEKGNQIFEEMVRNGIKVDILTYNALLLGLCNEGKTRRAAYLVKELDKKKLVPNSSTFAALIKGQCARKNPERAFQLYKCMIKSGCHPNEDTMKIMMSSFLLNDDYDGAFCVFKEMLVRPIGPDSVIFRELCKGFPQEWKDRLVMDLLKVVHDDGVFSGERYERVKSIITRSNDAGLEIRENCIS